MRHFPRPHRAFITTVAVVCFGSGMFGAHTANAVDKHIAVNEARAAAKEFEERRTQLQSSLGQADAVADQAAEVDEQSTIAEEAASLEEATESAVRAAAQAETAAAKAAGTSTEPDAVVAPVTAPTADEVAAASEAAEAGADESAEGATSATEDATDSDTTNDAAATEEPAAQDESGDVADEGAGTTGDDAGNSDSSAVAVADVLDVDDADYTDADSAREATEKLAEATAKLEEAAASLDTESQRLSEAAESALLGEATINFESLVEAANGDLEATSEIKTAVGDKIADAETLTAVTTARANLKAAAGLVLEADDSATAVERVNELTELRTALHDAVLAAQDSHQEWIDAENARRTEANAIALSDYEDEVAQAREDYAAANEAAVAARQNGWSGQPTGVSGSNGRLSSGSLCAVDFAPGHSLQCDAAEALEAADADYYAETGSHLSMTDSYRSYASQVTTRARKGSMAAVPGTSNHGWGMAVDLDHASATWLAANGAEYGWVHPTWARSGGSKPEWWHLEYVATEVGAFEAPEEPDLLEPVDDVLDDIVAALETDDSTTSTAASEDSEG
ncbi:M15 family metallopeptidase [Demequina sp. NBRC 110057]|uniref:M15 family metallopeptidase n=1 Tax=Demequina sp. NBRC 110057 TaxID=1570346 RepID=UPI000A01DFB5|nr:D-alanyl-D-alanine carboxypeptidase family protein [Demequina sp. NBRC 110057]